MAIVCATVPAAQLTYRRQAKQVGKDVMTLSPLGGGRLDSALPPPGRGWTRTSAGTYTRHSLETTVSSGWPCSTRSTAPVGMHLGDEVAIWLPTGDAGALPGGIRGVAV